MLNTLKYMSILLLVCGFSSFAFGQGQNKYKNKQKDGKWITYHDTTHTQIELEGRYKNGTQRGKWSYYAKEGYLEKEEFYKRKKVKVRFYYPDGKVRKRGDAKLVLTDTMYRFYFKGEWKCYNKKGELEKNNITN
jgi:antitoxin component YwqK of YwqJK toxin-antitoxin module